MSPNPIEALFEIDAFLDDVRLGAVASAITVHITCYDRDTSAKFDINHWRIMDAGERLASIRYQCYDVVGDRDFSVLGTQISV